MLTRLYLALQSAVFLAKTSAFGPDNLNATFRATDRWNRLWDLAIQGEERQSTRWGTLMRNILEIRWLIRTIVKAALSADFGCAYMKNIATDSFVDIHNFILIHKGLEY